MSALIRVAPYHYIHVLDNNTNVQRVECGPQTYTRQDGEKVVTGSQPKPMIVVPPRHFCIVADPYIRSDEQTKAALTDKFGQVKLRKGDVEIRFAEDWPQPFPLLPGETLQQPPTPLQIVAADTALRLRAKRDFTDSTGKKFVAGDEWLFHGPATYYQQVEVEVKETVRAILIQNDHALKLQARNAFVDASGIERKAGEEWLVRTVGQYMPHVDEKVLAVVQPRFLTQTQALHLRATNNFTDVYGAARKAGEEWLVTSTMAEIHLQDVHEEVVGSVTLTCLGKLQYCIVQDPVGKDGRNQYGTRDLRKGEAVFFLQPGERLEGGILSIHVLGEEEALLLRAKETFQDGGVTRRAGDQWMITGPCDYVPPVEVETVEKRKSIPLDVNEGIYVRDTKTGRVHAIRGQTYMLKAHEELWEKELPAEVEALLSGATPTDSRGARDKTRVVEYRVPHNAAVQIYDYKAKESRVVFGPELVMLDPDEQFTVLSLSGDKPKRPNVIKALALSLGPDFMTDIIEVETADHARLRLKLSYNWHFALDRAAEGAGASAVFQVRDFVGDACKAIASRVRGAVATQSFEEFHRSSAKLIRAAVFGTDEMGKVRDEFLFNANFLSITNIDIQTVEPVDERTRESLMKSVQLAIEITTRKQERNARHSAEQIEQDARSRIDRQKIINQTSAEESRQRLILLQGECAALASTGTAKAEAEAKAEYLEIESSADVEQAKLQAEASAIEARAQLEESKAMQECELDYETSMANLQLTKNKRLADIESNKFEALVTAISPETIKAIARAGPEMQARLLKGLGLKGYLMTDGNSPINLFNAAKGMVAAGGAPGMTPMSFDS